MRLGEQRIREALEGFADESIPEEPPASLPLLDAFRAERQRCDLSGTHVLFIQHHLGPFVRRLAAMLDDGLDTDKCWAADIPYSTNWRVLEEVQRLGVSGKQTATPLQDPLAPYTEFQLKRIEGLVRGLLDCIADDRLLVVDDGAYFVRVMRRLSYDEPAAFKALAGRTSIVEQTTRGHRYLSESKYRDVLAALRAPVVSIARTGTKRDIESPFIGAAVVRGLLGSLEQQGRRELGRMAVIGFGPVGQATLAALDRLPHEGPIDVVEVDEAKHPAIREAGGLPFVSLPLEQKYGVIAGCTGYSSFGLDDRFALADDALLVSGSSAAVEFNRRGFIELANALPDDEIEIVEPQDTRAAGIRAPIRLRDGSRTFCFLSAGFPINFDGRMECLPARMIQATHVLLYSAARQALQAESCGMVPFDPGEDEWIGSAALEFL